MFRFILFLLIITTSKNLYANIIIDNAIVYMDNKKAETISVKNNGDNKEYVAVNIRKIVNPGKENEECLILNKGNYKKFTKMCNSTDNIREIGLSISPLKMVLDPKTSRVLKVFNINESVDSEYIYRAEIVPIPSPFKIKGENNIGVKIQIGYEALIIIPPENPKYSYTFNRDNEFLKVVNTGNSNLLFFNGKICLDDTCKDIKPKRIYSGVTHNFELPINNKEATIEFDIREGNKIKKVTL